MTKFITKNGKKIPLNKPVDKTDYSKKVDAYFKKEDRSIEKKSMSIKEYKKAKGNYSSSAWGVNARELEREFDKQNKGGSELSRTDAIVMMGEAIGDAPKDKINRPILSHTDWEKIAKSKGISSKLSESIWQDYGKWHWEQHKKQTPIIRST